MTIDKLASLWRSEAERLRELGYSQAADTTETHAREMERAWQNEQMQELSPDEAHEYCGYSKSHLRRLARDGVIQNVGRPSAPRYLLSELKIKKGHVPPPRYGGPAPEPEPEPEPEERSTAQILAGRFGQPPRRRGK